MALEIKWTKRAEISFQRIVEYIEEEWSEKTAAKFVKKVNMFLKALELQPDIGKIEVEDKGIRGFVFSRQTTIFYRIKNNRIILLNFFDNRKNSKSKRI